MDSQNRKKVIIFTYYWPPCSSPGVWRFLKLSKYLLDYGWDPIIVTVKNGSYPNSDPSLLNDIPKEIKTYKTKTIEPFLIYNMLQGKKDKKVPEAMAGIKDSKKWYQRFSRFVRANMFIPDPRIGWRKYAVKQAEEIIKHEKIDAIITTSPPNSAHMIGLDIKKKFNIPWLMDFRDPWTSSYVNQLFLKRMDFVERKDKKMEDECLINADGVIGIGPGLLDEYSDRNKNITVLYNGFDEDNFGDKVLDLKTDQFIISWVGNFKPNMQTVAFWEALDELIAEHKDFKDKFRVQFVGNIDPNVLQYLMDKQLDHLLIIQGFVKHEKALEYMKDSNLLLFIIPHSAYSKNIMSGKIFEYVASQTPMLSLGPVDGDAAVLVNQAERAPMIAYEDKESMKKSIMEHFNAWKANNGISAKHNSDFSQFTRKKLAGKLAKILNEISSNE